MHAYDYAVLVFYFGFMLAISWVFRHFVANVSDYFRSGGKVLWWMVGASAFMVQFSAWTFTGAASKAYSDGWPIIAIYLANSAGFVLSAAYFAPRFRQLRVITAVQAIRLRFGRASEQVFTWLQIPLGTLQAGIWLNAMGVFFSAIFGLDLSLTIAGTGLAVLLMALIGGSWAVIASDFIQVLVLMPVCLAVTVLAVSHIGGVGEFLDRLPAAHLDLGQAFSKEFLGLWCAAMLLKQINSTNNLFDATRYLSVKDSHHARWAAILGAVLFIVGIVIWFTPPMAARVLFPELGSQYPHLRNPDEAAFIAVSRVVLPVGMMGLLVSGIFAATMSSMDSGLNRNAGIFIKNFYQPHFRPTGTEQHLLKVGRITTLVLGVIVILVALKLSTLRELNLFQQMQRVSILVAVPVLVPLLLGILIRRTPPWSAWSTVLVGFFCSMFISDFLTLAWAAQFFGVATPLDAASREYWTQSIQFFGNVIVGSAWFIGTKLFWRQTAPEAKTAIATFFNRLDTPVDFAAEHGAAEANDDRQSRLIGWLCLAYGAFIILLAIIPNPPTGRLAFVGCGGVVAAIGLLLVSRSRQIRPEPLPGNVQSIRR
jgi:solute:Na+ symporter, SSS family